MVLGGKEDSTLVFDGVEVEGEGAWDHCVSVIDCFLSLSFLDTDGFGREACMCSCGMGCGD